MMNVSDLIKDHGDVVEHLPRSFWMIVDGIRFPGRIFKRWIWNLLNAQRTCVSRNFKLNSAHLLAVGSDLLYFQIVSMKEKNRNIRVRRISKFLASESQSSVRIHVCASWQNWRTCAPYAALSITVRIGAGTSFFWYAKKIYQQATNQSMFFGQCTFSPLMPLNDVYVHADTETTTKYT